MEHMTQAEMEAHNAKLLATSRALNKLTIKQLRAKWCRLQDQPDFPRKLAGNTTFGEFMEATRILLQKLGALNHGR